MKDEYNFRVSVSTILKLVVARLLWTGLLQKLAYGQASQGFVARVTTKAWLWPGFTRPHFPGKLGLKPGKPGLARLAVFLTGHLMQGSLFTEFHVTHLQPHLPLQQELKCQLLQVVLALGFDQLRLPHWLPSRKLPVEQ